MTFSFSAEVHVRDFEYIQHIDVANVREKTICTIVDSCSTDELIAELFEVSHVCCSSYLLLLKVKKIDRIPQKI